MSLHPFMGMKEWNRIGMSVAESTARLKKIAYIDRQCMRIEAGHMIARPEYEVKGALGRFVWQDALHYDELRNRCKQLRMSVVAFEKEDDKLQKLTEKALDSSSTLELLVSLIEVIKPAQIRAIEDYLSLAQPIVDEPTITLLRHQLIDRREQLEWGKEALQYFRKEETDNGIGWRNYLRNLLDAAGGLDGKQAEMKQDPNLVVSTISFCLPTKSVRDDRFTTSMEKFQGIEIRDTDENRFHRMMIGRFTEMSPAEAVARVHFLTQDKPWEFYFDTARHIWDEVRHAWFGEAALREHGVNIYDVPNWVGFYDMCSAVLDLDEVYTHLTIAVEKASMKYPPGKREEWEFCRDIIKDPLMTTFQDFDWADEVVHTSFGQKWIVNDRHQGDVLQAKVASDLTVNKRQQFMAENGAVRDTFSRKIGY
jgi:hypothetical protein